MLKRFLRVSRLPLAMSLLLLTLAPAAARSEDEKPRASQASRTVPGTQATVDRIMTQAVANISRRYNLNDEQRRYTDELMRRDVTQFLRDHENEIWPVIRAMIAKTIDPENVPDNPEDVKRIGKAAQPLLAEAIKAIVEANEEWRTFLTEEQKAMHDHDLTEMNKTFKTIEKNFDSWAQGTATDNPIFPPPSKTAGMPPRPTKPVDGKLPEDPIGPATNPGVFEAIVETFLEEHPDLNQGQIDSARSILAEYKDKGRSFQNSVKEKLAEIDAKQRTALKARNRKQVAQADQERKILQQPFHELVAEMQLRLDILLTTAQRERHAQRKVDDAATKKTAAASGGKKHGPRTAQAKPQKKTTNKPSKPTAKSEKPANSGSADSAEKKPS